MLWKRNIILPNIKDKSKVLRALLMMAFFAPYMRKIKPELDKKIKEHNFTFK